MGEANTTFRLRTTGLNSVDASKETIILDELREKYFATNPAGSLLWNALKEQKTASDLQKILIDEFEIDHTTAEKDVGVYLEKLSGLNLIEEV